MRRKKLSARILSLVLTAAMVGTMLPATAFAAEGGDLTACKGEIKQTFGQPRADVVPRTTALDLTSASLTYVASDGTSTKTADPTTTSITDTGEGWSWDSTSKTLTLSGATITNEEVAEGTEYSLVSYRSYGIKLPTGSTIDLTEDTENFVSGGDIDKRSDVTTDQVLLESAGVCVDDTDTNVLTIQGKGKLNATGGNLETGDASKTILRSAYSYGIVSSDDLEIKGGAVIAAAGDIAANSKRPQAQSAGIWSWENITIADAAYVEAKGGYVESTFHVRGDGEPDGFAESYGLYASENITITGSAVEAVGGAVAHKDIEENVEGTPKSAGIFSDSDITISGGLVEVHALHAGISAMDGTVTIDNGSDIVAVACYYGIGAGTLSIDDSTVGARGFDEDAVMGLGIVSNSSISITSGQVLAEGTILAMACLDPDGNDHRQ